MERRVRKKYRDAANDEKLQGIFSGQGALKKRLLLRAKHMGSWTSLQGTTVTGTVIDATEFSDFSVIVTTLTP